MPLARAAASSRFSVAPTLGNASETNPPRNPPGAVHNPHEPEAQWSTKSTLREKFWVGYKVQVAETVQEQARAPGEPTANFITALVTQNAPASDKPGMAEVAGEQERMGVPPPSVLYVDGAYVSAEALKVAGEEGRELRGPAPASPDRGKVFTPEAFDVHVEERYAVCPGDQRSSSGRVGFRDRPGCCELGHCGAGLARLGLRDQVDAPDRAHGFAGQPEHPAGSGSPVAGRR